jgi:branched-chain amino acid transport system substrate-binding protein
MQKTLSWMPWLVLLACTSPKTDAKIEKKAETPAVPEIGDILIGQVGSTTGANATFGRSSRDGVAFAVKKFNDAGGLRIGGIQRKIKIVHYDDGSLPEGATQGVTKLIEQDKAIAIIGTENSSNALAAAPIAQRKGVVMLSPTATNPKLTEVGDFIFRACYVDSFQGRVMAIFAASDLKAAKAAILRDAKSDYSQGLAAEFAAAFKELGGEVIADEAYQAGDVHFKAQLTAIKAKKPDLIFVPGYYTEVGLILRQARELGLKMPMLGGDGWDSTKLVEIAGQAAEGAMFSNHYSASAETPEIKAFVSDFEAAFNYVPDSQAVMGYDGARLVLDALQRVKQLTPKDVRDALATTTRFAGLTGPLSIDASRGVIKPAVVLKVEYGKFKYLTTVNPYPGSK